MLDLISDGLASVTLQFDDTLHVILCLHLTLIVYALGSAAPFGMGATLVSEPRG